MVAAPCNVPMRHRRSHCNHHHQQQLLGFAFLCSVAITSTLSTTCCDSFALTMTTRRGRHETTLWGLSIPQKRMTVKSTLTTLFGTKDRSGGNGNDHRKNDNNDENEESSFGASLSAVNAARTDVRNFLTQRALQSFLFLLTQCRDEATVHWFEVRTYKWQSPPFFGHQTHTHNFCSTRLFVSLLYTHTCVALLLYRKHWIVPIWNCTTVPPPLI
jgi:hypothetical protein